jgi:hypothetical protein
MPVPYWHLELILQPRDVELQVGSDHHLPRPAGHFGHHPRGHVHDVATGTVQKVQKVNPNGFIARSGVSLEKKAKCQRTTTTSQESYQTHLLPFHPRERNKTSSPRA